MRTETTQAYKTRIYTTLTALCIAMSPVQGMWFEKLWPHADRQAIWKTLTETPTSEADIAVWYKIINDIIPTNEKLHRISMAPTDTGNECNNKDTLLHRLTECGESKAIWDLTQSHCKNVEDVPFKHTARMADVPTVLSVATSTPKGYAVGAVPACDM